MATLITGSTGFIGSYVTSRLLLATEEPLRLLVRARSRAEAEQKLWKALQLHMEFARFVELVKARVEFSLGDLTAPDFGLSDKGWAEACAETDSIIHIAASLNRKSDKACFNVNLRGTLTLARLARAIQDRHGLRRLSEVSTVAVAGERNHECVSEDRAIDWDRSDYDPYARTKKFCEHMLHELLPDVPLAIFRPSIVMGDSRFAATTQFDMVLAFSMLAQLPVLPFEPEWRLDIVPADFVGHAVADLHQRQQLKYGRYHLSAGAASLSYREVSEALRRSGHGVRHRFAPALSGPVGTLANWLSLTPRGLGAALPASLFKVFWPYLCFDTVFDNRRVVEELGRAPAPFGQYAHRLLRFATEHKFQYPYLPWPDDPAQAAALGPGPSSRSNQPTPGQAPRVASSAP